MKTHYLFGLPFVTISIGNREIDVLIDTGFNGALSLPDSVMEGITLLKMGPTEYVMADGTISSSDMYAAEIMWLGKVREVEIISSTSDIPLIGMDLLQYAKTTLYPSKNILSIEPA